MQFIPPRPYNPGMSPQDLQMLMMLSQQGKQPAQQGGGGGLGELLIGGGAVGGGASMLGGGGAGVAGAGAADLGIAAPSMMIPEMTPLAPSMGGVSAVAPGATMAGMSPMLGMAGVVAAPLIGSMIGKKMIGKNPYKSREYSKEDFGKRSNLAIKGYDKVDEPNRQKIGDILREYKGKNPLTMALDKIDGSASDKGEWNFELPSVAQRKVNSNLMGGDNKWGTVAGRNNLMKQHTASELFDMGKDALNSKHRAQIGDIVSRVDQLIAQGKQQGVGGNVKPVPRPTPQTMSKFSGKR